MRFASLTFLLLLSTPAMADWQYTKWGMSPDQAIEASGGNLRQTTASERTGEARFNQQPGLTGSYIAGEFKFNAFFYFDNTGLSMVALDLVDGAQSRALLDSVRARYGSPDENRSGGTLLSFRWIRPSEQNTVGLVGNASGAWMVLLYRPLLKTGSGL
jgi:hypothetical protein